MKRFLSIITILALTLGSALAQSPAPINLNVAPPVTAPVTIKGNMNIAFNTRLQPGKEGIYDVYTLAVTVGNTVGFGGTIKHRPFIANTFGSNQMGQLVFDVNTDVINSRNPSERVNVGKLFGTAVVDQQNAYRFDSGSVKMAIIGAGEASSFESRFAGVAYGKPPAATGLAKLQNAMKITGSKGAITLRRYDQMRFENHVIAAGPAKTYPDVTLNGVLFYDYDRSLWLFNNVTAVYGLNGARFQDNLTGTVRWAKSASGGEYIFDLRVNEPPPSEAAVFNAATDEDAFFKTNDAVPSLTGTMRYKDTTSGAGSVTASAIEIDLKGVKLTKAQAMYLAKVLLFSAVVPWNAE